MFFFYLFILFQVVTSKPLRSHKINKRYVLHDQLWKNCVITWAFRDPFKLFTNDVDYDISKTVLKRVMETWEKSAGGALTFIDLSPQNRTSPENEERKAKLDIMFARFNHGDLESFDGPGGLVAHSGYPPDGIVHFDASENWTVSDSKKEDSYVDLRYVALHEVGHALGLHHSSYPFSVMNPFYSNRSNSFSYELSRDDVYGIQELYSNCIQ
ncbi:hypothetical protein FO519_006501 [Halicephalobus sp. NKZ332]|nr:hypothetical protein FO519_006501 [Halicephalobus sp. NKZ332]